MDDILYFAALLDDDEDSDVDDLVALHILHDQENLGNRAALYGRFTLENMLDSECINLFRFNRDHIYRLSQALGLPQAVDVNRVPLRGVDAFCMLLRRLAYPNRLSDLEPLFGLSSAVLSNTCNQMLNIIINRKGHLLDDIATVTYLNHQKLTEYSHAIRQKGCPLDRCWGFIDGTARAICRPSIDQQHYYSGHKKMHCVKYQSVICPDGIVISLKGAYEGRRHDAGIFRESGLYEELQENVVFPNENEEFVLYGDQAYGLQQLLLRPYTEREINQNPERQQFNNLMSVLRISVEWGFNKILQEFAFLDFRKNQKLLLQDIESMYKVAMILTNCHTCLYGGETSSYFEIVPPLLEDYLGND